MNLMLLWGRQRLPVLVLLLVLLPLALLLLAAPGDGAPAVAVVDAITSSPPPTTSTAVGRELLQLDVRDSLCDAPDCSSCFRRPGESSRPELFVSWHIDSSIRISQSTYRSVDPSIHGLNQS
jgi:hypothetical protein